MPPRSAKKATARKPPLRAVKKTPPRPEPSTEETTPKAEPDARPAVEEQNAVEEPVECSEASAEAVASVTVEEEVVVVEMNPASGGSIDPPGVAPDPEEDRDGDDGIECKESEEEEEGPEDPEGEDLEGYDGIGCGEAEDGEEEFESEGEGAEEVKEEIAEGVVDDTERPGANNAGHDEGADWESDGNTSRSDDDDAESEDHKEDDMSLYMQAPLSESKKQKDFEIHVGGLHREAVDDDLMEIFGVFGEIQLVRIVRHPKTQKSKGFAFIRYTTIESAKRAITEFKDGTEVRGKRVRISANQDHDTLYLGNICKTWTRNEVIEKLEDFGVEHIEQILLPDDPNNEGHNKGYAFLEFGSHADAVSAFQLLRKPDAVFGCDISAKVAFAQASMHPSEEAMLQVRTVYVEGIPLSWDENKVKEICKQYGEVEKVLLSKNFTSKKRKDYGFVAFTSRESAVSCVEGINHSQFGVGVKVKANLARPQYKGRLAKQGARGGFNVQKNEESTKDSGLTKTKSKEVIDKGKASLKSKNAKTNKPLKIQDKVTENRFGVPDHPKLGQPGKRKKRGGRGIDVVTNDRPSKKSRKNRNFGISHARLFIAYGKQRHIGKPNVNYPAAVTSASRYALPATSHQAYAYGEASGSKHCRSDLEPHAGYLPPAQPQQVRNSYGYEHQRSRGYSNQLRIGSAYEGAASVPQASYPVYSSYAGYEAGYAYPSSGLYPPYRAYR